MKSMKKKFGLLTFFEHTGTQDSKIVKKFSIFLIHSNYFLDRITLVEKGYRLDELVNDSDWRVRHRIAEKGYYLNILINDSSIEVRNRALREMEKNIRGEYATYRKRNNLW